MFDSVWFVLQISTVTTVHTTLLDQFPNVFRKSQKRRLALLIGISVVGFLIGLAFATQVGYHYLLGIVTYMLSIFCLFNVEKWSVELKYFFS